jgi:hypothetical protein
MYFEATMKVVVYDWKLRRGVQRKWVSGLSYTRILVIEAVDSAQREFSHSVIDGTDSEGAVFINQTMACF